MLLNARTLARGGGRPDLILLAIEDITERKRAEQALRESEAMTRAGVETAVDGVVTIDERGTVLSFNPAAEQIFGYTGGEVIGQNVRMLVPAVLPGRARRLPGELPRGRQTARLIGIGREVRGRRKDGTIFPMDLHVSEFDDGAGRRFVGTIRDITERKRAEEQVRRHQAELAHVLRIATIERLAAGSGARAQPAAHRDRQRAWRRVPTYVRSGKREPRRLLDAARTRGSRSAARRRDRAPPARLRAAERAAARVDGPLRGGPQRDPLAGA